eukprot:jgi/Galph1/3805/GphlegSOOS_G2474.1
MFQLEANSKQYNETDVVSIRVSDLYNHYPFPPDPILDEPPLGYNWRWHYPTAYAFCAKRKPKLSSPLRILDAGCGTGCGTEYLVYLNPDAYVIGMDISEKALSIASERLAKSVPKESHRYEFIEKSVFDVHEIDGEFDLINCVGVIHHTADPLKALKALATKLKPSGIMHLFVYGKYGRSEIALMQKAIRLLLHEQSYEDWTEGVQIGRKLFASLPSNNRIVKREQERWARENKLDATFADMYVHPQEIDFTTESLFDMIDQANLQFLGFTNPKIFDVWRLVDRNDELLSKKVEGLNERQRYQLVELLDPDNMTHFELFLAKHSFQRFEWSETAMRNACVEISSCLHGWPSESILDKDYHPITLSSNEYAFMKHAWQWYQEKGTLPTVDNILEKSWLNREQLLSLVDRVLILLEPQPNN